MVSPAIARTQAGLSMIKLVTRRRAQLVVFAYRSSLPDRARPPNAGPALR